jgi:chemotaxis response regulator CheB
MACRTENAVGPPRKAVLSGGGTDGTLSFQPIKVEGDITIAQDEKTVGQPSMPRSATAANPAG